MQVAISADFLTAFSRIPRPQQKKVREFIGRFQVDPASPSINYEPIRSARDDRVRTVRIDLAYRAVVLHPSSGDTYILTWVDHHDEAMDWARSKQFEVNPVTGALQIIDTEAVQQATQAVALEAARELVEYALFEAFSDADLLRTGLPQPLLPAVRALRTAEELDRLEPYLPAEAYEALFWISNLGYSVEQALAEVAAKPIARVDADDLAGALEHPDSQRRFVVVKSVDELVEMLNAPMEKWRVFLHPSQRRLVQRSFNGPARVLGGAGTGKTVVAMHRARHLAADIFDRPTDRILFTTFTRNLAHNIEQNLHHLCGPEIDRIEVVNLHRWVAGFLRSQKIDVAIASDQDLDDCWRSAVSAVGSGEWPDAFYRNEWEHVVKAQGITDKAGYLTASRRGQGMRLSRPQRAAVWEVFDEFRRLLSALGQMEWIDAVTQTRLYLAGRGTILPYRAVVVDETQDLHPEELRLIRQIVPPGPNDLFLVGDAHQRIYGRPVVLSQCGIDVRGRSSKLRINYRTTEEIRDWSVAVLSDQPIDDLDGGLDDPTGYRSLLHGAPPTLRHFALAAEEQAFLVAKIQELLALHVAPETICLVARTHWQLEGYTRALAEAGIDYLYLQADARDDAGPGVRVATMHRVKGLEFAHMIVGGANDGVLPSPRVVEAGNEVQERCLLHVASSRARDTLTITSYGRPSPFLARSRGEHA